MDEQDDKQSESWAANAVHYTKIGFTILIPVLVALGVNQQSVVDVETALLEGIHDGAIVGGALIASGMSIYHQLEARFNRRK